MRSEWKKLGTIGVDAGLCWIGDPCYLFGKDAKEVIGVTWHEFVDKLEAGGMHGGKESLTFPHQNHIDGFGIVVHTGYGDGCYDVLGRFATAEDGSHAKGRLAEIRIVFIERREKVPGRL